MIEQVLESRYSQLLEELAKVGPYSLQVLNGGFEPSKALFDGLWLWVERFVHCSKLDLQIRRHAFFYTSESSRRSFASLGMT
jgi:hypothetical protein